MKKIYMILLAIVTMAPGLVEEATSPNVIIILTDDQGFGDLGFNGNSLVKTPTIDRLARTSIRFNNFHVSPVCAPTRSSLMTGRYSLRTGIRDTYNGGAIMASGEITIAEMLKGVNYKTGVFGKWHLGDNYPSRPMDQGFDESLIHLSGGMGQPGDITTYFKRDRSYFDPVLWHNGDTAQYQGYCTDIFADNALRFIEKNKDSPFFCYIAFNAPHTPLQVPDRYYQMYANVDPSLDFEKSDVFGLDMSEKDKEDAKKVYGMVTNIDDNVEKILDQLDELKLRENTIVFFMTDNGPQQLRYTAGMRGKKGSVYRGGNRVPCFMSYPAKYKGNKDIDQLVVHMDIMPTLSQLCNAALPQDRMIDGRSFLPLMDNMTADWPERSLFLYWSRRYPELYNNMSLQRGDFKLVGQTDYNAKPEDFELYNIHEDPSEQYNIISKHPDVATRLKTELDDVYKELINSKNIVDPPLIHIGSEQENPVILNRNDTDGERGVWRQEEAYGKWNVSIEEGSYNIRFKFLNKVEPGGKMYLETNAMINQMTNQSSGDIIEMNHIHLPEMEGELVPFYHVKGKDILPFWVELMKID